VNRPAEIPTFTSSRDVGVVGCGNLPQDPHPAPSSDLLAELRDLRSKVSLMKCELAGIERARQNAVSDAACAHRATARAEQAERSVTADRDRWKQHALKCEAELKSLAPRGRR
jgi:hypothetical protein